jgi:outer membrane protein assembly factor BamD (BamD/ComL family)
LQVQQYDKDVETAIASARQYFDAYPGKPNASHLIVLDIDETSLSNRAEWLRMMSNSQQGSMLMVS